VAVPGALTAPFGPLKWEFLHATLTPLDIRRGFGVFINKEKRAVGVSGALIIYTAVTSRTLIKQRESIRGYRKDTRNFSPSGIHVG
jgi:hypothetical protein